MLDFIGGQMRNSFYNNSISLAMCTCDGSNYLNEQLDSISNQSKLTAELVVFDDVSADSTVALIKNFTKIAPFPVKLFRNKRRLGTVQNFSQAIRVCKSDYIALCDQDDIWLPNKLELSLKAMKEAEEEYGSQLPLLVHTDLAVIDAGGKKIAPSFIKLRRINPYDDKPLPRLLAQNFVTGNTVLINRPLAEAALPIPEEAMMHDWWLALVAAAAGKIIFVEEPTVLYRQHRTNVIGAGGFFTMENIRRLVDFKKMEKEVAGSLKQAKALKQHLEEKRLEPPLWFSDFLSRITGGGMEALRTTRRNRVYKQGFIRDTIYKILLLKGGYLKYLD